MEKSPHYKLIYGACVEMTSTQCVAPNIIEPFQRFDLPKRDDFGYYFIGFQYGTVEGPYEKLQYAYGSLKLSSSTVTQSIKDAFWETYPELALKAKTYAIMTNVYTTTYVTGRVMYGYWIHGYDNDETDDALSDLRGNNHAFVDNIFVEPPDHNTKNAISKYFIGKELALIDNNADCEPEMCHIQAKQLTKTYRPCESFPSREILLSLLHKIDPKLTLSPFPMIAVIQTMCHCCT